MAGPAADPRTTPRVQKCDPVLIIPAMPLPLETPAPGLASTPQVETDKPAPEPNRIRKAFREAIEKLVADLKAMMRREERTPEHRNPPN
jgi:hypothetical protein